MNPQTLDLKSPHPSPSATPSKRRVLGELQISPLYRNIPNKSPNYYKSPIVEEYLVKTPVGALRKSPVIKESANNSKTKSTVSNKIGKIFEERSSFKMWNKENEVPVINEAFDDRSVINEAFDDRSVITEASVISDTFLRLDVEKISQVQSLDEVKEDWSVDFTNKISHSEEPETAMKEVYVPEGDTEGVDMDFQDLQDLEEEFEADNFDHCTKYEIVSTDSPDIISRGRGTDRKIESADFIFGAPLAENEPSTSFGRNSATRVLSFEEETVDFTSPVNKKANLSVKKSLKFSEAPTKFSEAPTKFSPTKFSAAPTKFSPTKFSVAPAKSSEAPTKFNETPMKFGTYNSESTTVSTESGFVSEFDEACLDIEEQSNSPKIANFQGLLSGQIKTSFSKEFAIKRPLINRSLSCNVPVTKAKVSLLSILESPKEKGVKRYETERSDSACKRRKSDVAVSLTKKRAGLMRAFSENNASIMSALVKTASDTELIGDFSAPFALPLTRGVHEDLKSISSHTLAALLRGTYDDTIARYQIIDCRYPYEFEGGHIAGALNLYTRERVEGLLSEAPPTRGRRVLVFHCEFSLERGPTLSRFLRSTDRAHNESSYPFLHYPEMYILHEGYRNFYQLYPELCSPGGYTPMLDPRHRHQLRQLRSKRKF